MSLDPEKQSSEEPPQSRNSADKKVGWIEGLAQRSSGLPEGGGGGGVKPPQTAPGERSLMSYAGLGIQFAGPDRNFHDYGPRTGSTDGLDALGHGKPRDDLEERRFLPADQRGDEKSNHSGPSPPPIPVGSSRSDKGMQK